MLFHHFSCVKLKPNGDSGTRDGHELPFGQTGVWWFPALPPGRHPFRGRALVSLPRHLCVLPLSGHLPEQAGLGGTEHRSIQRTNCRESPNQQFVPISFKHSCNPILYIFYKISAMCRSCELSSAAFIWINSILLPSF